MEVTKYIAAYQNNANNYEVKMYEICNNEANVSINTSNSRNVINMGKKNLMADVSWS